MAGFTFLDATALDFTDAPVFRKTASLQKDKVEVVASRQTVFTIINGVVETPDGVVAEIGDRIITGPMGERYVLNAETFKVLWGTNGDGFKSKNIVRAIELKEDTEIIASFGRRQRAKAGGVMVESLLTGSRYLIEQNEFAKTYAPEAPSRSSLNRQPDRAMALKVKNG